ncbi:MAG TPA: hypothetical protein VM938_10815 [Acidimicrobiales bacterium]|nr:hypothetical protein [Acidimicrobiales bacterium]
MLARLDVAFTAAREHAQIGPGYEHAWFSDSLTIGFPITTWHGENEFLDVVTMAERVQFELARAGFATRGGFALGAFFMDGNVTFGPALVEAVKLERNATTPRVVLSPDVVALARSLLPSYGKGSTWTPHSDFLVIDNAGRVFVNYLDAARNYCSGDDKDELLPLLGEHSALIQRGLLDHRDNPCVRVKYEWLARYHNWYCDRAGLPAARVAGFGAEALAPFS